MWYFDPISCCRFQKYGANTRTVNIQMLIWRHICFTIFWLCSALRRLLMFLSRRVHVFVFTRLPSSRFTFDLPLSCFNFLISSHSLIFLLLYLASLDDVLGCSQLNWPWYFHSVIQGQYPPILSPSNFSHPWVPRILIPLPQVKFF